MTDPPENGCRRKSCSITSRLYCCDSSISNWIKLISRMASGFTRHGVKSGSTLETHEKPDGRKGLSKHEGCNVPSPVGHPALTRQSAVKQSHLQARDSCRESNTSLPEIRIPDETSQSSRLVPGHRKVQYTRSCEDMTGNRSMSQPGMTRNQSSQPDMMGYQSGHARARLSSQGDTGLTGKTDGGEPDHTILFQTASRLLRSQNTDPDVQPSSRQPSSFQTGHRSSPVPGNRITSPPDKPQIFFRKKSKKLVLRLPSGELLEGKNIIYSAHKNYA